MEHQAYRCCLPTLAGFAGNHCIGPDFHRRPTGRSPTPSPPRGIPPGYSGLPVRGTANSPPSTTKSLGNSKNWSRWSGSNRRPTVYETVALPAELHRLPKTSPPYYATPWSSGKQIALRSGSWWICFAQRMNIPLEDDYTDIIGKAKRGLGLTNLPLPTRSDDETALRRLASVLRLDPDALVASAQKAWYPRDPGAMDGLACFNTPYSDMTVNSYLVFDPQTKRAAAFDTGTDCDDMLKFAADKGLTIKLILLTHSHGDH